MSDPTSYLLIVLIGGGEKAAFATPQSGGGATRYVVFDRALPLSESATAGVDHHAMTMTERLAALLITDLEGQPAIAVAIALVRAAMALAGATRRSEAISMTDAPELPLPLPPAPPKAWLVTRGDGTTRTIEAAAFRVEGGALVLMLPAGCAAAFAPGLWTTIESVPPTEHSGEGRQQ